MDDQKTTLAQELFHTFSQFFRLRGQDHSHKGIKQSEFMLLATLMNHMEPIDVGMKVSELSNLMQITPAAVTHLINSLEEGSYIERMADPEDRRVVLIKPTAKGKETIQVIGTKFLEKFKDLVGYLGEKDSKELMRLLSLTFTFFKERRSK